MRFLPLLDDDGRAMVGPEGYWLMAFPGQPEPAKMPEPARATPDRRLASGPTFAPSLFDSPSAVPGTSVLHIGTGEYTISQDNGSVYITLKVGLDALRRIIGKD